MTTANLVPGIEEILAAKRYYLAERKRKTPLEAIRALASMQKRPQPFLNTITNQEEPLLIGQIRYAPNEADVPYDPVAQAVRYARFGLDAVALFTDSTIYEGGLDDLMFVAKAVQSMNVPVISQDYIFDEYQLVEARAAGAAAVVLTASIVDATRLRLLVSAAQRNRMTGLVYVATQEELDRVLDISPQVIALNNHHPKTGDYDPASVAALRPTIPSHINVAVGGGLKSAERLRSAAALMVDALLINEPMLEGSDIAGLRRLLSSDPKASTPDDTHTA